MHEALLYICCLLINWAIQAQNQWHTRFVNSHKSIDIHIDIRLTTCTSDIAHKSHLVARHVIANPLFSSGHTDDGHRGYNSGYIWQYAHNQLGRGTTEAHTNGTVNHVNEISILSWLLPNLSLHLEHFKIAYDFVSYTQSNLFNGVQCKNAINWCLRFSIQNLWFAYYFVFRR